MSISSSWAIRMSHIYQAMADKLGIADWVTFTGKIEYRDAPFYLSLGDIGVAPKISSTEGSGKLLNYMALAQPVVAYDTAVHREYLADLGVYAPVGDVAAFAQAIDDLAAKPGTHGRIRPKTAPTGRKSIQLGNGRKANN